MEYRRSDAQKITAGHTFSGWSDGSGVAWDDAFWTDAPMLGSLVPISGDGPDDTRAILVPDGAGDYREHRVTDRPKGRLGF